MVKVSEIILTLLLIAEIAYVYLFCTGQIHWRFLEPYGNARPPAVFNPMGAASTKAVIDAFADCITSASRAYQVPVNVMLGIIYVEGGHIGQEAGPNFNGTYDLGLMQVNTLWLPQLAELWHVDYPTAYQWVRDSGCENIYVGTWILKQKIAETGSLYDGIAFYHSGTRGLGTAYANKVISKMKQKGLIRLPKKKSYSR